MHGFFGRLSRRVALAVGTPTAFLLALLSVLAWAVLGPAANFSEFWQLTINTGTTIVTFLMVFLIQGAQNHDSRALHLKLDEVIHALNAARDDFMEAEVQDDVELNRLAADLRTFKENHD